MSNELEPLADPGLPEHIHRKADTDPIAAKRAERQVAVLFSLSAVGTLLFIFSYFFVDQDQFIFIPILGSTNAHQLGIGIGMAMSLLFIGFGAVHWAKTLMPDQEVIAYRHEMRSEDSDREDFVKAAKAGAETAGLGRRPLIKRALAAAAGLAGLPAILLLRDLGPLPGNALNETFKPIVSPGIDIYNYTLLIYDRWGELIFESHDIEIGWDGTYGIDQNKMEVQDGIYTWKMIFKAVGNAERKVAIGTVNVMR